MFCLFQCFGETEYQTESKRNETFENVIFSPNVIQETWTLLQGTEEAVTRVGARPLPRGPLGAPPAYFFLLYIHTYLQTIRTEAKNLIPPPQLSVSMRSHLGACSGAPPKEGLHHHSVGECCRKQKNFLSFTKINLWSQLATRGECIYIPLWIASGSVQENGDDGVVLAVIQITDDQVLNGQHIHVQHTYGEDDVSSFLIQQGGRRG